MRLHTDSEIAEMSSEDTLHFLKRDRPAAEFETGVSSGGSCPCVGCNCHCHQFVDFPHAP